MEKNFETIAEMVQAMENGEVEIDEPIEVIEEPIEIEVDESAFEEKEETEPVVEEPTVSEPTENTEPAGEKPVKTPVQNPKPIINRTEAQAIEMMKVLAAEAGFGNNVQGYLNAVEEQRLEKNAKARGIDPTTYKFMNEQAKKIDSLERGQQAQLVQKKLGEITTTIDNFAAKHNLKREEVLQDLETSGIKDITQLAALPNLETYLVGASSKTLQSKVEANVTAKVSKLNSVETQANISDQPVKETIDDQVERDIAKWRAQNNY